MTKCELAFMYEPSSSIGYAFHEMMFIVNHGRDYDFTEEDYDILDMACELEQLIAIDWRPVEGYGPIRITYSHETEEWDDEIELPF